MRGVLSGLFDLKLHKELHTHRILELLQAPSTGKAAICAAFAEPSGGLEPPTPPYHGRGRPRRRAPSGAIGQKLGKTSGTMLCLKDRKGPVSGAFPVAGAGFEPATSGL